MSRLRAPPPTPWPDGGPESLRSPCCGLAIHKKTKPNHYRCKKSPSLLISNIDTTIAVMFLWPPLIQRTAAVVEILLSHHGLLLCLLDQHSVHRYQNRAAVV
ncbi:hypothetical protein PoB_000203500 [Plakobranchus ocellatus]|uniref:Uncharacterized protein n=1 Tax=Plakobranchus ocellatus TaxID=259542 RepID=A0AAV3XXK8_9GAST|nr:hypothetical protein PoB_000203500 [Plakobranchus ocellatus]